MFDGLNHIKSVNKLIEKKTCCNHGEHENIDVICNFKFLPDHDSWKDRVCKKCFIPERLQNDHEYIERLYNVGVKENAK